MDISKVFDTVSHLLVEMGKDLFIRYIVAMYFLFIKKRQTFLGSEVIAIFWRNAYFTSYRSMVVKV